MSGCLICEGLLPVHPGGGRPRKLCSDDCRRVHDARRKKASFNPKTSRKWSPLRREVHKRRQQQEATHV